MPTGPRQKRPADVISATVKVMRIATGQEEETDPTSGKNPSAVALGKLGGAKAGRRARPPFHRRIGVKLRRKMQLAVGRIVTVNLALAAQLS
jgi:hypothetical protein